MHVTAAHRFHQPPARSVGRGQFGNQLRQAPGDIGQIAHQRRPGPGQKAPLSRAFWTLAPCSAKVSAKQDVPSVSQRTK